MLYQPAILRPRMAFILQRIIIFANGDLPDLNQARALLHADDFIICADGGTRHALALGLTPKLVIGDMDSIEKQTWADLQAANIPVELYPRDKNETDLELAITRAIELEPKEIIIIAALGGRLDQTLANLALLSNPQNAPRTTRHAPRTTHHAPRSMHHATHNIRLDDGAEEIFFCRDQAQIHGRSGDVISLIPWGNPVHGIQTHGLRWALTDETLYPEKTRGISNELLSETASVKISSGNLLVIHTRKP